MTNAPTRSIHQDRILRADEVVSITGLSKSTLWRLESEGKFVVRRQLSPGAVGWMSSEVENWLANRQAVTPATTIQVAIGSKRGRKPKVTSVNSGPTKAASRVLRRLR